MRAWLSIVVLGGTVLAGACSKESGSSSSGDRICTPGAFVFCRCQDRSEGTKLCKDDARSFEACDCGEGSLAPDGDSRFTPVDGGAPDPGGPVLPGSCAGKLALVASSDAEIDLYAALYTGGGAFAVGKSQGPALRSLPHAANVNGSLVAVWLSRYKLLAWTKFAPGQTSLSPPSTVGSAMSNDTPSISGGTVAARLLYLGDDGAHHQGVYGDSTGWDEATAVVPAPTPDAGPALGGKSPPAVATAGNDIVYAYTSGGSVAVQTIGQPAPVVVATGASAVGPALAALDGARDLVLVYQGGNQVLRYLTRERATKTWSAPATVDTTANAEDRPELAPMTGGRAMLIWKATSRPFFSVFDGTGWKLPAAVLGSQNPVVTSTPSVTTGRCGSEATAAYADGEGRVAVVQYANGVFSGPFVVTGLSKMTYVGVGELP